MMIRLRATLLSVSALLIVVLNVATVAADEEQGVQRVFLIGNSLTWDTVPTRLDGHVKFHVDCGKSLPYIVANPEAPCVKTSSLWPDTLPKEEFDVLCLQVHYGATLGEDIKAIGELIKHQPAAVVVIHSGWARSAERDAEWNGGTEVNDATKMVHCASYYDQLLKTLTEKYPTRKFRRTYAADALQVVQDDIDSKKAPVSKLTELYRDKIHMNLVTGRYLMHNAMRQAIGQPKSQAGFAKLSAEMQTYLDTVLDRIDVSQSDK